MATLKIIIVVICLFIHFDYFSAETSCYTATTKEHCLAIGKCQIVTGEVCSKNMVKPPCSLKFNNGEYKSCCSNDTVNKEPNVVYLGCIPSVYLCLTQCMKNTATGELYIVYEGCAFSSGNWTDASADDTCIDCVDEFCSSENIDNTVTILLILTSLAFVGAVVLGVILVTTFIAFVLIRRKRLKDGSAYSEMTLAYLPEIDTVNRSKEVSQLPPVDEKNVINVRWTENGTLRIPMADGTFREVTAEKYQRLHANQMEKRKKQIVVVHNEIELSNIVTGENLDDNTTQ